MPNLSKGQSVGITGLGEFENGQTYVISEEDHAVWQAANAVLEDELDDKGLPTGHVVPRSPGTLLTAFKDVDGIQVSKASGKTKDEPKSEDVPTAKERGK